MSADRTLTGQTNYDNVSARYPDTGSDRTQDEVGRPPGHGHDRCVQIAGHHGRHDRAVDDPQSLDAAYPQPAVDDVVLVRAHGAGADGVVAAASLVETGVDDVLVVAYAGAGQSLGRDLAGDRFGLEEFPHAPEEGGSHRAVVVGAVVVRGDRER